MNLFLLEQGTHLTFAGQLQTRWAAQAGQIVQLFLLAAASLVYWLKAKVSWVLCRCSGEAAAHICH